MQGRTQTGNREGATRTRRGPLIGLFMLAGIGGVLTAAGEPPPGGANPDRARLEAAGIGTSPEGLRRYLDDRVPTEETAGQIDALIERLGSETWQEREAAERELIDLGTLPLPALERALGSPSPEIASRAAHAIGAIRNGEGLSLLVAAATLLSREGVPEDADRIWSALETSGVSPTTPEAIDLVEAVARCADAARIDRFLQTARDGQDDTGRLLAACVLIARRDKRGMEPLIDLTDSEEEEIAQTAAVLVSTCSGVGFSGDTELWRTWWSLHGEDFETERLQLVFVRKIAIETDLVNPERLHLIRLDTGEVRSVSQDALEAGMEIPEDLCLVGNWGTLVPINRRIPNLNHPGEDVQVAPLASRIPFEEIRSVPEEIRWSDRMPGDGMMGGGGTELLFLVRSSSGTTYKVETTMDWRPTADGSDSRMIFHIRYARLR